MTARWRTVRADLLTHPLRSALAVLSLAVGVAMVGAMLAAGDHIAESVDTTHLGTNPPSAVLGVDRLDADLVDRVRAHPDVGQAEARRRLPARAASADGGGWVNVELVAMGDDANRVARVEPVDGVWPPDDAAIVVEQASLGDLGTGIGEDVTVLLPGQEPVDLAVVGTAHDAYEIAPSLGGPTRGYVSLATMADLAGPGLDTLYVRAGEDPLDRDTAVALAATLRDEVVEPAGLVVRSSEIRDPSEHRARDGVMFMVPTLQVLSLLALLIAVVLVVNIVTALLAQQRRHIGVMKAVGATSRQLTAQYLAFVLALGLAALVVALPLSLLASRLLTGWVADLANMDVAGTPAPWLPVAAEAAVALVVPVVAVVWAVRRASRRRVLDAIVDRGLRTVGSGTRLRIPVARPVLLALRNALRNPARLVLTVATVTLTGAVLVGVLSTNRSLDRVTDQVAGYWDYDVGITLTEPAPTADVAAVVGADPTVADVEGWSRTQGFRVRPDGTENENVTVHGVPPGSPSLRPTLTGGRWLQAGDERAAVVNSNVLDEEADLAVGDDLVLDVEGTRQAWRIVGSVTTTLVGPEVYVPAAELARTVDRPGEANLLAVRLEAGADQERAAEAIEEGARAAGVPVGAVETHDGRRDYVAGQFGIVVGFLVGVSAILAVVAVVGVAGTMTLGVVEQTREIGVLRTLGASSGAVRRLFLWQGLAVAALGWAAGALLAAPVGLLLQRVIGESLLVEPLPAAYAWPAVGLWLAVALAIGAIAATRPARVAARLTVRETLAYE